MNKLLIDWSIIYSIFYMTKKWNPMDAYVNLIRVCVYPTPPLQAECDTVSVAQGGKPMSQVYRLELPKLCYHPGWRLMRLGYRTCFHTLYDKKKKYMTKKWNPMDAYVNLIRVCVYPTPPLQAECDTRSIFKREYSFPSPRLVPEWGSSLPQHFTHKWGGEEEIELGHSSGH